MPTGWVLLQGGCLLACGHSISMPADLFSLNIACLLALCFSICYTSWYGVSLSAMSVGIVSHYQPCLLVWWIIIIDHAFWFGTSLSAMPVGVVPHCRSCLLVWCLTIGHTCWYGTSLLAMPAGPFCTSTDILTSWEQTEEGWLQVWCYSYRGAITSDMFADPVPLPYMPACTVKSYQTCMLGSFIQIHMFVKCLFIRWEIWYVTNPPDMSTG